MDEIIKRKLRMLVLVVATGTFAVLSGCASTGSVSDLQSQLNSISADAAAAKSDAAAANAKADDAVNVANEANRRSMDTETKIDRMFKRAMHK